MDKEKENNMRLQAFIVPSDGEEIKWLLILDNVGRDVSADNIDRLRNVISNTAKEIGAIGSLVVTDKIDAL